MCTGNCSKFIGAALYPFSGLCILCNILLLFPDWKLEAVQDPSEKLTAEVLYLGGVFGSGLMVLLSAIAIQCVGRRGKCNNRCGMFASIFLAGVAVCGSVYGFATSLLGLVNGPQCYYKFLSGNQRWTAPFKMDLEYLELKRSYLFHKEVWTRCTLPAGVVEFNIILFSTIMVASAIQIVLCLIQMINGLFGCLCGTCQKR
ncbi:transmembrane 4 L6 family member 4-like [Hyperolius riggenbachi]|uniref:transmembrane 4 L6 family member 4-like n=1 Tax=Hyperolius riggenbachi TaxID=752182 RepID=UPI0035A3A65F